MNEVEVAEIGKAARLEERKLIEEGLCKRQKAAFDHEIAIHKLRMQRQG